MPPDQTAPCVCGPNSPCPLDCPFRPAALAEPAMAWGIVRDGKLLHVAFPRRPEDAVLLPNERQARVRITEVREDA